MMIDSIEQMILNHAKVKYVFLLCLGFMNAIDIDAQVINFTDLELKSYLINEPCIDTLSVPHNNGVGQIDADLNNDNEIQWSEMLQVKRVFISDFNGNYGITSISDLSQFEHLVFLSIVQVHGITEVSNLNLVNLKSLRIADCGNIKRIDISDLVGLTESLRLEGLGGIDYLNIKNGSVANAFSLFYTENIKYACIDSIAKEYDAFSNQGGMILGRTPSIDCVTSVMDVPEAEFMMHIYPNPATEYFTIENADRTVSEVWIYDISGRLVRTIQSGYDQIHISNLEKGAYHVVVFSKDNREVHQLIVQ